MNNETKETKKQRPSHAVYVVNGDGENGVFTKIGVAFPNKDGKGFNLVVGRIVLRDIADKNDAAAGAQ